MTIATPPVPAPGAQPTPVGPPPPFDAEMTAIVETIAESLPPTITPDMISRLRGDGGVAPGLTNDDLAGNGAFEVSEISVPGPAGAPDVALLVCRPTATTIEAAGAGPGTAQPVIYHSHGGGMIIGDFRTGLLSILDWARQLGLVVVSVDYRLAPEHPHPAPVEDCYAGLRWTADHAAEIGGDPGRLIVAGPSAGGGLSAALALLARDRGGPALAGQVLMSPMLDDRNDTPSAVQMAGRGVWDRSANETGWGALLGPARGGPDVSPYAAPARAADLSGLPPAYVDVGSAETFRDEDVAYASGIWRAGGQAELHVWPGAFHGFDMLAPHTAIARQAKAARLLWLRRLLAR
ncbi:alpha/beta hydrolase [Pseudofrankia asymbiotica]|uniref:Esterase n=1 Tax=Pseudofrankia asymbiotica TaxID=1834516 RepID=A0A1V2IAW5_9ACTN|nr:alpha/beta hydrolase [Pseudofrankia asymbiotica]ONH30352.1 esterase [Pseudofrankia asymbiotica]